MKTLAFVSVLIFAALPTVATGADFTIEDSELSSLPREIEQAIRSRKKFEYPDCKLKGKQINLSGNSRSSGFAVTTAEACDWGAAQGPIWIVSNLNEPSVVLEYGGYFLVLQKERNDGLRNVKIGAATAGHSSESTWKFDGHQYVKLKEDIRVNR